MEKTTKRGKKKFRAFQSVDNKSKSVAKLKTKMEPCIIVYLYLLVLNQRSRGVAKNEYQKIVKP